MTQLPAANPRADHRLGPRLRRTLLAFGMVTLAACSTVNTTQSGTVGIDREQRFSSLVPADQLQAGAQQAYQQTLAEARQNGKLDTDQQALQRVRRITNKLVPATAVFRKEAPGWAWEIHVISSEQRNAWAMPGGKMAIYTGIIDDLKLTDNELAAILGHEMAHALREHGRERASRQATQQLAVGVIGAATGASQDVAKLADATLNLTFNLPNSRTQESEADRIGIELAARAGYDPRAAVSLWQKMSQVSGGSPPAFLSTHPPHDKRIQELQRYAEVVMPLYQQSASR